MAKDIDVLLEQQAYQMTAVLKSHASHIESMLAQHRFQVVQLALHNSPEPFVREVFNRLRDRLVQVTINEAGLADAEDARYLLRILDRMELSALEGKPF
jgi:tRNA splicing ligase